MEFKKVDVNEYVKKGLEEGILVPKIAVKFAKIIARQGIVGQKVESFTENGLSEKVSTVELDEVTNQPGWIATKVDLEGNIIIDEFGHKNQWIISDSEFIKKYEIDLENPTLFKPKGGPQVFVEIQDSIVFNQRGSEMNVEKGGFLNITNIDNIYGISKRDFEDTYQFVADESVKNKLI